MNRTEKDLLISTSALVDEWFDQLRNAGRSEKTIKFYHERMIVFLRFCDDLGVTKVGGIDHRLVTDYLKMLRETGREKGGVHANYRALSAFLNWFYRIYRPDPDIWANPLVQIIKPAKPKLILEPIPLSDVEKLIKYCERRGGYYGTRNRALFYALLDTGARARELLAVKIRNLNMQEGSIFIEHGKGDKARVVFIGQTTKQAIRAYLRLRPEAEPNEPLFSKENGGPITYEGLRDIFEDYAQKAGVSEPNAHSFRRAFALNSLRNKIDVYSLQKLMGHGDLSVLRQYLAQNNDDLKNAFQSSSPVDRMKKR